MGINVDKYIVKKPWGNEYIICKNKKTATWLLNIEYKKKTSLHCHPKKKTGFILLDGKVEVMLGFYEKRILKEKENVHYVLNKIYILLYMKSSSILVLTLIVFLIVIYYFYYNIFEITYNKKIHPLINQYKKKWKNI